MNDPFELVTYMWTCMHLHSDFSPNLFPFLLIATNTNLLTGELRFSLRGG